MAASTASTCNSCVFFEDHSDASAGVCRAHPPVPSSVETNKPAAIWPLVKTDDWCGQHTAGRS